MAALSGLSLPHFRGNGGVASGGLVAASCIPDRDKPGTSPAENFSVKPLHLPTYKAGRSLYVHGPSYLLDSDLT